MACSFWICSDTIGGYFVVVEQSRHIEIFNLPSQNSINGIRMTKIGKGRVQGLVQKVKFIDKTFFVETVQGKKFRKTLLYSRPLRSSIFTNFLTLQTTFACWDVCLFVNFMDFCTWRRNVLRQFFC